MIKPIAIAIISTTGMMVPQQDFMTACATGQ
jgi:hypothetical protein